jgi:hypothetical protein
MLGRSLQNSVGREMLADARFDENDVHWRKNLAYYSTTLAGDGFVLEVPKWPAECIVSLVREPFRGFDVRSGEDLGEEERSSTFISFDRSSTEMILARAAASVNPAETSSRKRAQ